MAKSKRHPSRVKRVTSPNADQLDRLIKSARIARSQGRDLVMSYQSATVRDDELVIMMLGKNKTYVRTLQVGTGVTDALTKQFGELSRVVEERSAALSAEEKATLKKGGWKPLPAGRTSPSAQGAAAYAALLATSYSADKAAEVLGVDSSRVRQLLGERRLYGIKDGREWRLPAFQFAKNRLVPGIDRVLPKLPSTAHPLAIARWFDTPQPDLVVGDDEVSMTPGDWLRSGGDPEQLALLATEL